MKTDPKTDLKKLVIVTCNALNSIQTSVEHVLDELEHLTEKYCEQPIRTQQKTDKPLRLH
jgi:hypothetical protein